MMQCILQVPIEINKTVCSLLRLRKVHLEMKSQMVRLRSKQGNRRLPYSATSLALKEEEAILILKYV